ALKLGEVERARVELAREYNLQEEVVAANAGRIEKEQEEAAKNDNVRTAMESGKGQITSGIEQDTEISAELSVYADYVNPFTVFLDGLYHGAVALDASDMERARRSMERVSVFAPRNAAVRHVVATLSQGRRIAPGVYVIFETGMAPKLKEESFKLVLPTQHVSYVGLSYPKLVTSPAAVRYLCIRAGGVEVKTERVASMDAVIGREFNNNFPSILTKAIAATATKTVAAAAVNEVAKRSKKTWMRIGIWVGTLFYQAATDVADTRSWQTLPKEFQVARLDIPSDRTLSLVSPNGTGQQSVKLMDGEVVVVYAKCISQFHDMTVAQFTLR
ncbi:MAG: hypothetical protein FWF84_08110, partial [Kiritimatiellaeota bacterium]|nr:hypothetical protein [Kiritimatiellota bacterium]